MGRTIATVVSAFLAGMLFGYIVFSMFGGLLANFVWLPGGFATAYVLCGLVFAFSAANRERRRLARQQARSEYAAVSGLRYAGKGPEVVVDQIKQLTSYDGSSRLENAMSGRVENLSMTVGDLIHQSSGENGRITKRTVAHFHGQELDFPHFTMQREAPLISFAGNLLGVKDINFQGHPSFSSAYHLSSDDPDATRKLFADECLEFFAANPGWEVRAERDQIMMTRNHLVEADDLDAFIERAKAILALLRFYHQQSHDLGVDSQTDRSTNFAGTAATAAEASEVASPRPRETTMRRGTSPSQRQTTDEAPQNWLAQRVEAHKVTWEDVERFIESPTPRGVPVAIRRQRVGCTSLFLIGFFCLFGIMASFLFVLSVVDSNAPFGVVVVSGLIVIAAVIVVAIIVNKRQKAMKILRVGLLTEAELVEVKSTGWEVNSQPQFKVTFRYHADGQKRLKKLKIYGAHADLARDVLESGKQTPLLVDPDSPHRCVLGIQLTNPVRLRL